MRGVRGWLWKGRGRVARPPRARAADKEGSGRTALCCAGPSLPAEPPAGPGGLGPGLRGMPRSGCGALRVAAAERCGLRGRFGQRCPETSGCGGARAGFPNPFPQRKHFALRAARSGVPQQTHSGINSLRNASSAGCKPSAKFLF